MPKIKSRPKRWEGLNSCNYFVIGQYPSDAFDYTIQMRNCASTTTTKEATMPKTKNMQMHRQRLIDLEAVILGHCREQFNIPHGKHTASIDFETDYADELKAVEVVFLFDDDSIDDVNITYWG